MSLQLDVEEFVTSLRTLCESSEEDVAIDTGSTTVIDQSQDADSDIEVIACYREVPNYPPQLEAGRAMTIDLGTCSEERVQSLYMPSGSIDSTFDTSDSLVDWFVGSPSQQTYVADDPNHCMADCSRIEQFLTRPCHTLQLITGHQPVQAMPRGRPRERTKMRG